MTTRIVWTILLSALLSACGATRTAAWDVEASAGSTDQALVDQLKASIATNWDNRIDRAATEAAEPPEEPPGDKLASHGLVTGP